jgi:hypothetical protein
MLLKELEWEEVLIGMKLCSLADPNVIGTIVKKNYAPEEDRENSINIEWSNGNTSARVWHWWQHNEIVED